LDWHAGAGIEEQPRSLFIIKLLEIMLGINLDFSFVGGYGHVEELMYMEWVS
jgi:hypothetical protein